MLTLIKTFLENALRFETDIVLNLFCHVLSMDGPTMQEVQRESHLSINLWAFEQTFSKMISLSIILCLFIHNSRQ